MGRAAIASAALLFVSLGGCAESQSASGPFSATIVFDLTHPGQPVNRRLLGSNIQWVDRGDELLKADGSFDPRMLERLKLLSPTVLRYPGGCLADTFHWQGGVGPLSRRRLNERFFDRRKEEILFGVEELLGLCRDLGAEPLLTVNVPTGTPEEAAQWVKQTQAWSTGPEKYPPVIWWEIGNEPYLKPDKRPELILTPADFAFKAGAIIDAIKSVDAKANVGLPLRSDSIGGKPATPMQGFNDTVLSALAKKVDFVAVHNAYLPTLLGADASDDDLFRAAMAADAVIAADIAATRRQVAKYTRAKDLPIAVTEHSAIFTLGRRTDRYIATLAGALYLIDSLRVFADNDVLMANHWSLSGNGYFGGISNRGEERPAFWALVAANKVWRGTRVAASADAPRLSNRSVGFVPARSDAPAITVLAAREGEMLRALIVNKDLLFPARVRLEARGAGPIDKAECKILTHAKPFAEASEMSGWIDAAPETTSWPLSIDLPAHSLWWGELRTKEPPR